MFLFALQPAENLLNSRALKYLCFFVLSFVLCFAIFLFCSQCYKTFAKVRKHESQVVRLYTLFLKRCATIFTRCRPCRSTGLSLFKRCRVY